MLWALALLALGIGPRAYGEYGYFFLILSAVWFSVTIKQLYLYLTYETF